MKHLLPINKKGNSMKGNTKGFLGQLHLEKYSMTGCNPCRLLGTSPSQLVGIGKEAME